ncbi:hypothetical protein H0H93_007011 [Arthromyces matolae]|nr:hypothetical protein H0H93_007011 [Arthromyces matolae]
MITFDYGSNWQSLRAPSRDSDGHAFECDTSDSERCSLHIHSITTPHNFGCIFSSPAPGFVMGVGHVGEARTTYEESDTSSAQTPDTLSLMEMNVFLSGPTGVCAGDPNQTYMGSSGYRKIPGNTCTGGVAKDHQVQKKTSDNILWSMSSFPSSTSISAPSTLGPLVRTAHIDQDPELTDETTPQELYVIEPQSGDIYVVSKPTSPLQRFPFTMSELVDMSPFTLPGSEDGRVFVGRKETSLLLIELETGRIKATLNSECAWEHQDDDGELDLDELEESKPPLSTPTEAYIGRTDYFVSIRDTHGNAGPRLPAQNLSFSVYGPNNKDNVVQATYRHTKDDTYVQSTSNDEIIAFKTRPKDIRGQAYSLPLWASAFSVPMSVLFLQFLMTSDRVSTELLPSTFSENQHLIHHVTGILSRPLLQDVLPSFTSETRLPNREAAYVGLVAATRNEDPNEDNLATPASSLVIQFPKPPPTAPSLVVSETVLGMNTLYGLWLGLCGSGDFENWYTRSGKSECLIGHKQHQGHLKATGSVSGAPGVEYQRALQLSIPVVQPLWISLVIWRKTHPPSQDDANRVLLPRRNTYRHFQRIQLRPTTINVSSKPFPWGWGAHY